MLERYLAQLESSAGLTFALRMQHPRYLRLTQLGNVSSMISELCWTSHALCRLIFAVILSGAQIVLYCFAMEDNLKTLLTLHMLFEEICAIILSGARQCSRWE